MFPVFLVCIKDYYLSLRPRLRVLVPPCCVHRDSYTISHLYLYSDSILDSLKYQSKLLYTALLKCAGNIVLEKSTDTHTEIILPSCITKAKK